jgi:hypothetical protein
VKASADLAEYEVTLRHDSMAPRYRLWFWFTVTNVTPGQRAIISVVRPKLRMHTTLLECALLDAL